MRTINQRVAIAYRDVGKGREQERKLCRSVRTAHPKVDFSPEEQESSHLFTCMYLTLYLPLE